MITKYERQYTVDDEVDVIPLEEKGHNRAVHSCEVCGCQRIYGFGKPERMRHLLQCAGKCKKHTWHKFLKIY